MAKFKRGETPHTGHRFKPGNKAAVGHRMAQHPSFCTQELISILNEMSKKKKNKSKVYVICDNLVELAMGMDYEAIDKNGNVVTLTALPDLGAIKEIFDRVQGKAPLSITHNNTTLDDIPDDVKVKDVVKDLIARGLPIPEGLLDDVDDDHPVH